MGYDSMQLPLKNDIDVIPFNSKDDLFRFLGNDVLEQPQNDNRYSDLFRIRGNQIAKVFFPCKESLRHVNTLISVINENYAYDNKYFTLPTSLLLLKGRIVGYTMPYLRGHTLLEIILRRENSSEELAFWFSEIINAINTLPPHVHIGDLHPNNIIIDEHNSLHIIDIDGFSIDGVHYYPCPLKRGSVLFLKRNNIERYDEQVASKFTDLLCVYKIIFDYMFREKKIDYLSAAEFKWYLLFLLREGIPVSFVFSYLKLVIFRSVSIRPESVLALKHSELKNVSYTVYNSKRITKVLNNNAVSKLESIISERTANNDR